MWKNPKKIPAYIKTDVNKSLQRICVGKYYDEIPIAEIFEALADNNIVALQEDNTEWTGFLCGEQANVQFNVAAEWSYDDNNGIFYTPCDNSVLVLSWYRMSSGRYEINAYLS